MEEVVVMTVTVPFTDDICRQPSNDVTRITGEDGITHMTDYDVPLSDARSRYHSIFSGFGCMLPESFCSQP